MEENKPLFSEKFKKYFIKYLPIIISLFVTLMISLSFIGNYYEIRYKESGVKYDELFSLADLCFVNPAGNGVQVFFCIVYLICPLIACVLLLFTNYFKNLYIVSLLLFLLCGVTSIVTKDVFVYVLSNQVNFDYSVHDIYISSVLPTIAFFVSSLLVLSLATNKMEFNVGDITETGILVAIALGLNFIKFLPFPTGGSVNLQMLPLFVLTLRRGPIKGFIGSGIVYGVISCLTDGYGFAFYPFDYLIGFGSACVLGFFNPLILSKTQLNYNVKGEIFLLVGGVLASFVRFIGGCISSMIFYSYSLLAAMEYNALYVFVSGGISIALIMMVYGPLLRVHHYFPPTKRQELPEE